MCKFAYVCQEFEFRGVENARATRHCPNYSHCDQNLGQIFFDFLQGTFFDRRIAQCVAVARQDVFASVFRRFVLLFFRVFFQD